MKDIAGLLSSLAICRCKSAGSDLTDIKWHYKIADIEVDEQFIYYGDFSIETAYRIASEIFQSSRLPDAILTSNNRTTIGLIKAAREHNIRLGRDLALIGIDRVTLLDALGYPFSCITRDSRAMGREAVHLLLKRMRMQIKRIAKSILHHIIFS